MNAIDKDPTLEAVNYQPAWPSRTAERGPLTNKTFARNLIASGAIVGPAGEGASIRRNDYIVGLIVILMFALSVFCVGSYLFLMVKP